MNQFPLSPWVEIFAAQGWPPVSTTPVANLPPVSTPPVANLLPVSRHDRRQILPPVSLVLSIPAANTAKYSNLLTFLLCSKHLCIFQILLLRFFFSWYDFASLNYFLKRLIRDTHPKLDILHTKCDAGKDSLIICCWNRRMEREEGGGGIPSSHTVLTKCLTKNDKVFSSFFLPNGLNGTNLVHLQNGSRHSRLCLPSLVYSVRL